jgi:hypothetical protein
MIAPSDDDYRDTRRLKIHGTELPSPFKELAKWIAARYGVHVLNIILDTIEPDGRPRLSVILEWAGEERRFMEEQFPNFDPPKQCEVRERFAAIAGEQANRKIDMARLLVIFSSFEPVARTDANWRVTDRDIEQLKRALNDNDLWEIRRGFATVTFFFHTDAQVKANEASGARERFALAYAQLTAPYDEFGYLAKRGITVCLDSKENFDSVYRGNWVYYDKDH